MSSRLKRSNEERYLNSVLTIIDMRVVIACSESTSLRDASDKLKISQPAISYKIRSVEKFYGRVILYRNTRSGIGRLTPFGELIVKEFKKIIEIHNWLMRIKESEFEDDITLDEESSDDDN